MNCRDATALIEKLVDGEARESERSRAETHLKSCETCRAGKRLLERTAEAMQAGAKTVTEQDAPAGYWESLPERVLARIDEEQDPKGGWLRGAYPFMALAASLVLAVTVVLLMSRDRGGNYLEAPTAQSPAPRAAEVDAAEDQPALEDREESVAEAAGARSATLPQTTRSADQARAEPPEPDADTAPDAGAEEQTLSAESRSQLRSLGYTADEAPADAERSEALEALSAVRARRMSERERDDRATANADMRGTEMPGEAEPAEPAEAEEAAIEEAASAAAPAPPPTAAPTTPSVTRDALRPSFVSVSSPCERLREQLSQLPEDTEPERTEKLYELAQCSIERYDTIGTSQLKELAVSDIESFLAVESETERARELQEALTRLQ